MGNSDCVLVLPDVVDTEPVIRPLTSLGILLGGNRGPGRKGVIQRKLHNNSSIPELFPFC
jgi:hypothetical protein